MDGGATFAPSSRRTPEERISSIEDWSGGTLPTRLVLALSQSQLEDPQLQRASVLLAQRFDLPPSWFFRPFEGFNVGRHKWAAPVRLFHDPGNPEEPLSWAAAKRLVRPFEANLIAGMLSRQVATHDPTLVLKVIKAMAPMSGEHVAFAPVLAAALQIAGEFSVDTVLPRFAQNMKVVSSSPSLAPLMQIAIAHEAAKRGLVLENLADVAKLVVPGAEQAIELGERFPSEAEAAATRARLEAAAAEGKPIPATLEQVGAKPTEASFGQAVVAAFKTPGDLLAQLQDTQDNYIEAAKELNAVVHIPFSDSFVGHTVGKALNLVNRPFGVAIRSVFGAAEFLVSPITEQMQEPGHLVGTRSVAEIWGDTYRDALDIWHGRSTEFAELEKLGIPAWATGTIELFFAFKLPALDPLIAGGKLVTRAHEMRTIFGLAERGRAGEWPERVAAFVRDPVGRIGDLRDLSISQYLLREADRTRDAATFYNRAIDNFRRYFGAGGIHPMVAERMWRFAQASRKARLPQALRERAVDEVLLSGFGVTPRSGSLASEIETVFRGQRARVAEQLPLGLTTDPLYIVQPAARLERDAETALGVLSDTALSLALHGPLMTEIPHLAGPLTRAEHALRTSALAESSLGRTVRTIFQQNPKRIGARFVISIEDPVEAARDFDRALVRSEVFDANEMATARLELQAAIRPDNPLRELNFMAVVSRYDRLQVERLAAKYGIPDDLVTRIVDGLDAKLGRAGRREVFGVEVGVSPGGVVEPREIREPFLMTQRPNQWQMLDPLLLRRGIAETVGTYRKWRAGMLRALGASNVPAAKAVKIPMRRFIDNALDLVVRDLFLSWFKPLIVIRPAYILRVVGLEEQSRFLATAGGARRLESGEHGARILSGVDRVLGRERSLVLDVQDTLAGTRIPETKVLGPDGAPLRVYHGTPVAFDEPDLAQLKSWEPGMFFAEDPTIASAYAGPRAITVWTSVPSVEMRRTIAESLRASPFYRQQYEAGVERFLKTGKRADLRGPPINDIDSAFRIANAMDFKGAPNVRFGYLNITNPLDETRVFTHSEAEAVFTRASEAGVVDAQDLAAMRAQLRSLQRDPLGEDIWRIIDDNARDGKMVRDVLSAAGFDGVRHVGRLDKRVWIAFRPEQIINGYGLEEAITRRQALSFPRPGLLPNEPLANNLTNRFALASEEGPMRRLLEATFANKWGVVEKTDPQFYDWWFNALQEQFGRDVVGRRYLDDIARGVSEQDSVDRAMVWLLDRSGEGPRYVQRLLGQPISEISQETLRLQVERGVRYAHDLTSGHPQLAAAARDNLLKAEDLRAVPVDEVPAFVHGPLVSESVLARIGPIKRATDGVARWILQEPTNRLSRQPYFKSWYDRMLRALVVTAKETGVPMTDELLAGFRETAREFGVAQVKRIMFDFTREGRIDELTRNVLMFVQPYLEWPVVWTRIIRQNPAFIGYAVRLGRTAIQSGVVRTDPETGELVVPMSWWAGAAPLLAAVTGGQLRPIGQGGGWELVAPLTSFNLFAQSAFSFPTGGIAGELPIPMPSVNPEALWVMQQMLLHTDMDAPVKARLSSWMFAYGAVSPSNPASFLPPYLRRSLEALMPGWFETEQNLAATHFLQLQEAMGLEPDAELARTQAREFAGLRALFGLIFPAAPRINFPTEELERQYRETIDALGFVDGTEQWMKLHPDLRLITIPRTMWSEDNPTPIAVPTNQLAAQLLQTKGAREFAQAHPLWAWAIIPSELREGKFDYGSYFAQLASGLRVALSPEEYLARGDVRKGWDAFFAEQERWLAWQEVHPDLGVGDPSYEQAANEHQEAIDELRGLNPSWALEAGRIELYGTDPRVLAEARRLSTDKLFTQTDAGAGLVDYLRLRDETIDELSSRNLTSVRTITADRLGITERYDSEVAKIIEAHPDFGTAYRLFFFSDLQHVKTAGDRALDAVPPDVYDEQITPWWEQFETLRAQPNRAGSEGERNMAYENIRVFVEQAYERFDAKTNPLILRWKTWDPNERSEYLVSLVGRGYMFYSRFDRQTLLGDASTPKAEALWSTYNLARIQIAEAEATDPNFTSSDAYKALDAWVRAEAAANKTFAEQIAHANSWGYAFSKVLPELFTSTRQSGAYWQAFLDAVDEVEATVYAYKLHGDAEFDPNRKVAYTALRRILSGYIDILRQESLAFRQQWDWLEEQSGPDPLLSYFMPDTFFPVGGYPGEK